MRKRWVAGALQEGWTVPATTLQASVQALKASLHDSHNATAIALGVSRHAVRRVLTGLPGRPEEQQHMDRALRALSSLDIAQPKRGDRRG